MRVRIDEAIGGQINVALSRLDNLLTVKVRITYDAHKLTNNVVWWETL